MPTEPTRSPRSASASNFEQSRTLAKARNDLALRQQLDMEISRKQRLGQPSGTPAPADDDTPVGSETLVREAHRVLLRYLPAIALPDQLWAVRALLDAHMFGRDHRVHRDDVVRVARQIDRMSDGT